MLNKGFHSGTFKTVIFIRRQIYNVFWWFSMGEKTSLVNTVKPIVLLTTYMTQPIHINIVRNITRSVFSEILIAYVNDLKERLEFLKGLEHYDVDEKELEKLEEKIANHIIEQEKVNEIIDIAVNELVKENRIKIDEHNRVILNNNVEIEQFRNGQIERLIRSELYNIEETSPLKVFEIDGEVTVNLLTGKIKICGSVLEEFLNSNPEIVDKFSEFIAKKISRKL